LINRPTPLWSGDICVSTDSGNCSAIVHCSSREQIRSMILSEGSIPKPTKAIRMAGDGVIEDQRREQFRRDLTRHIAISCWREDTRESAAMWKIYAPGSRGVVIRTTWGDLKTALEDSWDWIDVGGRVRYLDFDTDYQDEYIALLPFFWKRSSYSFEQEIRLLISKVPLSRYQLPAGAESPIENGVVFNIDPVRLIGAVHLSPNASDNHLAVVRKLAHRAGIDPGLVRRSEMDDSPVY